MKGKRAQFEKMLADKERRGAKEGSKAEEKMDTKQMKKKSASKR
jgi:hypothetical protein